MSRASQGPLASARLASLPLPTFLVLLVVAIASTGCGSGGNTLGGPTTAAAASVAPITSNQAITVTPATASVSVGGETQAFIATLPASVSGSVAWQVNGVSGGDATVGTISTAGQYQSPAVMPSQSTIVITAVSTADPTESGTATVTLVAAPPVAVSVQPTSANVFAGGGTMKFTATVTNTANSGVTWQVNGVPGGDATVGTIGTDGTYTAPATPPAQATVTVTAISVADAGRSASASVTISPALAGVTVIVAPSAAAVPAGGSLAFQATVLNASSTAVTWQVNGTTGGNTTVGTISTTGVYTAPAQVPSPATVTITAVSAADLTRSGSASVTITVPTSISVSPAGADVQAGIGTQAFTATVTNAASTAVVWQVNGVTGGDATNGTITTGGLYTAPAEVPASSTVTVTAALASDSTVSSNAKVSIKPHVTVSVSPSSATAQAGVGTQAFVASVGNASNTAVTWQVNGVGGGNATVGTIASTGVYTAPAAVPTPAGVTITAVSVLDSRRSASASLTVTSPVTVTVSPANARVAVGGTLALTVAVGNTTNTAVTWQVNGTTGGNATVGTVSSNGVYTAPAAPPSPANVTVTAVSVADPTRSGSASLTVAAPITVSVSPSAASVGTGGTQQFNASVTNGTSGTVTWQVNGTAGGNSTVGTISGAGLYTAPAQVPSPAIVTITAVSVDDPTRSGTASVTIAATVTVSVSPSAASVATSSTQQFNATVTNGTSSAVTWQVNGTTGGNSTIGTISSAGLYSAPAQVPSPATVTVTAVSVADPTRSANASVTVTAATSTPLTNGVYSDIVSAPVGAWVTVYGSGFGATAGTATLSGKPVTIVSWSDTKVVVQVPSGATSGTLSVAGNSLPLNVHTGRVIEVTTATLASAVQKLQPGDTIYLHAGTYTGHYDNLNWASTASINLQVGGTAAQPVAFIAYPGEVVTFDNSALHGYDNFWLSGPNGHADFVTIAGFQLVGWQGCVYGGGDTADSTKPDSGGHYVRVVANTCTITDATNNTMGGMLEVSGTGGRVLGNTLVDPANRVVINNNHGIYIQNGVKDTEIANNVLKGIHVGHAIQVHQDGTPMVYQVSIHDNYLEATNPGDMRGINVGNVDSSSTITIANNTLKNLGGGFSAVAIYTGQVAVTNNYFDGIVVQGGGAIMDNGLAGGTRVITVTGNRIGVAPNTNTTYIYYAGGSSSEVTLSGNSYCGAGSPPAQDATGTSC